MITPKEIQQKAERLFFKIMTSHFRGEPIFPITIPGNKQITGTNFSQWKNDIVPLHDNSKAAKGKGYSVAWTTKTINGSSQTVPGKVFFEELEDYLFFSGKNNDYKNLIKARENINEKLPALNDWATNHPALLLTYIEEWDKLINVCLYFVSNPPPHRFYLRELPIKVDSKFIENHGDILKKLLDQLLPADWINISERDFVARYQLKKTTIYTQIRVLDDELKPHLGFDECALSLDDAAWLSWKPENVFIIENKACFLSFPKVKNSVAIFGEGFKSRLSKHLPWLESTTLYCWFDLDTAGFEMVNMIREYYPACRTLLMDQATYDTFGEFSVFNKNRAKLLPNLTYDENALYNFLAINNIRLEQERISQDYIIVFLQNLL